MLITIRSMHKAIFRAALGAAFFASPMVSAAHEGVNAESAGLSQSAAHSVAESVAQPVAQSFGSDEVVQCLPDTTHDVWPTSAADEPAAAAQLSVASAESAASDDRFPVPVELEPAVDFWRTLFLSYDNDKALIHDREHPQIIWRVLDLPKHDDGRVNDAASQRFMREELRSTREGLNRLAAGEAPADALERTLDVIAGPDKSVLDGAGRRVRVQRGVANYFRAGGERATNWLTQIVAVLTEERVPAELSALPFVESMFTPHARSAVGAAGIWQLMPGTARNLGLRVRADSDERLDVLRSTRAAARMLRKNFEILGSWPLALTAYNHGPNGVRRAVERVGSKDLMVLIDGYKRSTWGFASKNFYAEFVAALRILRTDPAFSAHLALSAAPQAPQSVAEKLQ